MLAKLYRSRTGKNLVINDDVHTFDKIRGKACLDVWSTFIECNTSMYKVMLIGTMAKLTSISDGSRGEGPGPSLSKTL